MAGTTKQRKVRGSSDDEIMDLSAGFVPKNTPAANEPDSDELTPDSFMAQYGTAVDPAGSETEKVDFVPEEDVVPDDSEPKPIEEKNAEITWRWATESDMPALQLIHFQAEIAAGMELHLPELSFPGGIAIAQQDGKIVGGLVSEESVVVSLIGMDREVLKSAGEVVIPKIVDLASKEKKRFLHSSLPGHLAADLGGALQKAGFTPVEPGAVAYQMELKAEDSSTAKRKN
jgi:hypothetical protein